jgi:hypothetical protein
VFFYEIFSYIFSKDFAPSAVLKDIKAAIKRLPIVWPSLVVLVCSKFVKNDF